MERNSLPQPIAYGRTAEIYPWQEGKVLKLFNDWYPLESIHYERRISQAVHSSGVPVPSVGEIVQVNGLNGLIFQRLDGRTMLEVLTNKPWKTLRYARRMAELHAEMHSASIQVNLPNQQDRLIRKISFAKALPDVLRAKVLSDLDSMPGGSRLCHNDFHPDNIMITSQGEIIIDWGDASLGNPLADMARTSVIILGAIESEQVPNPVHKTIFRLFHRTYLNQYFAFLPGDKAEYLRWMPIVAAARLNEGIPEVENWLLTQVKTAYKYY